jgi:hypothetical protein
MSTHFVWVMFWFELGMISYMLKRAYYGINPPNPVATGYYNYLQRAGVPLFIRGFLETLFFWIFFTPGFADKALVYFGWTSYDWAVQAATSVAPVAGLLGHAIDSIADMAISKVPGLNTILPQMPGPLPAPVVVQAQVVEQTTRVTQLQTQTTQDTKPSGG